MAAALIVFSLAGCGSAQQPKPKSQTPVTPPKLVSGMLPGVQVVAASKLAEADKQAISQWIAAGNPSDGAPTLNADSYTPLVDGHVLLATTDTTSNNGIVEPVLVLQLDPEGTKLLADYTGAHPNETIVVVLNGRVVMASTLPSPITDGRIVVSGDQAWIDSVAKSILPAQ